MDIPTLINKTKLNIKDLKETLVLLNKDLIFFKDCQKGYKRIEGGYFENDYFYKQKETEKRIEYIRGSLQAKEEILKDLEYIC